MSLIPWKNLPDTSTPVNAENLKNDSEYLDEKTNPNIITASVSSNYTITSTATYETLVLNSATNVGDKLSLTNDGAILIGPNVSHIKVSAKVSFQTLTPGTKWATIYKNNGAVIANPMNLSERGFVYSTDTIIDVASGDKIYLKIQGNASDLIRGTATYTNITIEVVD